MSVTRPTTKQVWALQQVALSRGDYHLFDVCARILATDTVDQDGNPIPMADWTKEEAYAYVARIQRDAL